MVAATAAAAITSRGQAGQLKTRRRALAVQRVLPKKRYKLRPTISRKYPQIP